MAAFRRGRRLGQAGLPVYVSFGVHRAGLGTCWSCSGPVIVAGHAFVQNLGRGPHDLGTGVASGSGVADAFAHLALDLIIGEEDSVTTPRLHPTQQCQPGLGSSDGQGGTDTLTGIESVVGSTTATVTVL